MADNVQVTAGSGTSIAADEVVDATLGTVKVGYVKIMDGTIDGTGKASVGSNGLSVDVKASVNPTGAATAANQTTMIGHLDGVEGLLTTIDADTGTIAGAISGTEMQVDVITMPTVNVADGGGSLSVDDGGTTLSVDDGGGSITVDGTVSVSGSVAVTNAALSVTGGGTEATALRVTLANDSTGVVSIDDNGGSITVDATSLPLPTGAATAANQSTIIGHVDGIEGLLTTIDSDTSTLAGAVSGTEMQVDIVSAPTLTVQATNLDIRDLSSASDSVTVHGDVGVVDQFDLTNSNPLAVAIVDASGNQIASFGGGTQYTEGDVDASITGTAMLAEGPTNTLAPLQVNASNNLKVNIENASIPVTDNGGSLTVDGTVAATQSGTWNITNVSGTVSLPTGASTSANQTTIIGHVDGIETLLTTIDADTSTLAGAVSGTEVQVDIVSAPTLTVQATNLDVRDLSAASDSVTVHGDVGAIDQLDLTNSNPVTVAIVDGAGDQITSFGGGVQYTEGNTDASITGTAMLWEDTSDTLRPVSAAKPLPVNIVSGSSSGTEYTEGDIDASITGTAILAEGPTNTLTPLQVNASSNLKVNVENASIPVTDNGGSLTVDGTVAATQSGTWNITNVSGTVSLPTGASTSANQTTIIGHVDGIETLLTTIDADTSVIAGAVSGTEVQVDIVSAPTLTVQATNLDVRDLSSASDSVTVHGDVGVIDQLDLTNSNPVTVAIVDASGDQITSFGGGVQYTEGDVDASITGTAILAEGPTNTLTPLQVNASSNLKVNVENTSIAVTDGGGSLTVDGTVAATQSGTWNITNVSGTVSLPTGAATAANQTTIIGHVDGIEGLLTTIDADTSTLAGAISGTEMQVDIVSAPTLNVADAGGSLTVDNATLSVTGAGLEASALRVTIASDSTGVLSVDDNGGSLTVDGTVAATQSGTWNVTNVSGTVSLPTGASTAANQTTIIGHLDGVEGLLTTIDADTSTIAGAVSGTEMQVDIVSMPAVDTELASAITMGSGMSNPTTAPVAAFNAMWNGSSWDRTRSQSDNADGVATSTNGHMSTAAHNFVFNGTSWDRTRGNATDGVLVNLGANNDVTVTSSALPTGASTAANQSTIIGHLDGVEGLLTTIDADTSTIAGAVSGTEMQVDIVSAPTLTVADGGGSLTIDNAALSVTGGGVEASALRVTIANDSTGVVSIDDNGGSITVDGTVTVTATNLDIRDLTSASDSVAVHGDVGVLDQLDLTNSNPAVVAIVDANGDQITSFGGGTQYTEGDTDASITGTAMLMEGAANTLVPVQGTTADGLLVNLGSNNDVTVTSSALPTGASTSANQTTIIGHLDGVEGLLTTIDADTGALAGCVAGTEIQVDIVSAPTLTVQDGGGSLTIDNAALSVTGGGVEASALRVTIANDSTGVLSVDDNGSTLSIDDGGGSITVDGTVTVTSTNLDIRDLTSASDSVAVHGDVGVLDQFDLANSNPAVVAIVDGSGNQITSFGGGTQYTEGDTDATITGTAMLMEGAGNALVVAQGTAADGLLVNLGTNNDVTVTGSVSATQSGTWILGANSGVDIGDVTINNASGASAVNIQDGGNSITVDGTVAATQSGTWNVGTVTTVTTVTTLSGTTTLTPGTGASNLGKAEDAAHTTGDVGVMILGRRIDTAAASSGTSGDYSTIDVSAQGAVWTTTTPTTTSGCDIFRSIDLDETEEDVKTSAGNVYGYFAYNAAASIRYIKFYNATAASTTVGTTTPVLTFPLPPGAAANVGFPYPISFSTAICVAAVTGVADSSTGAPGANEVIINVFYK